MALQCQGYSQDQRSLFKCRILVKTCVRDWLIGINLDNICFIALFQYFSHHQILVVFIIAYHFFFLSALYFHQSYIVHAWFVINQGPLNSVRGTYKIRDLSVAYQANQPLSMPTKVQNHKSILKSLEYPQCHMVKVHFNCGQISKNVIRFQYST